MATEYYGIEIPMGMENIPQALEIAFKSLPINAGATEEQVQESVKAQLSSLLGIQAKQTRATATERVAELDKVLQASGDYAKLLESVEEGRTTLARALFGEKTEKTITLKGNKATFALADYAKVKPVKGMTLEFDGEFWQGETEIAEGAFALKLDEVRLFALDFAKSNGVSDAVEIEMKDGRASLKAKSAKSAPKERGEGTGTRVHTVTVKYGGNEITRVSTKEALAWLAQKGAFGNDKDEMTRQGKPKNEGGHGAGNVVNDARNQEKYGYQVFAIDENGYEHPYSTR